MNKTLNKSLLGRFKNVFEVWALSFEVLIHGLISQLEVSYESYEVRHRPERLADSSFFVGNRNRFALLSSTHVNVCSQ